MLENKPPPKIAKEKFFHQEFVKNIEPSNDRMLKTYETLIPHLFTFIC